MSIRSSHSPRGVALLFACLLGGCAAPGEKASAPLDQVTTISVYRYVVLPPSVHYMSSGQVWGMAVGGLVGGAIAASSGPKQTLGAALDERHVDMGAIFREEMRAALGRQTHFRLVDDPADAELTLTVRDYGFNAAGPFTGKMNVLLDAECELRDRSGRLVFKRSHRETNREATRFTMDEYFADPARLQAAFHEAAAAVAAKEIEDLTRPYRNTATPEPADAATTASAPAGS